jgi:tetratricopeptide (TPR) repeat protein
MRRRSSTFVFILILAGITLALYWPAGKFEEAGFDDADFTQNPDVLSGLNAHSLWWAVSGTAAANWHPVTSLTFVVTHQLFGANAGAEHRVNFFIHAANAALLFLVLRRMTGATWRSALVAALFAWHPFRVESVAWIAERKDVLCAFFVFLTLWFWTLRQEKLKAGEPKAGLFFALSLTAFALSLLSKAMSVTLPFGLLLLDVWPFQRAADLKVQTWSKLLREKIPFFVLTVIFCLVTFQVQRGQHATASLDELGLGIRLENVTVSYLRYLGWALWPTHLAAYYTFPYDEHFYLALWPGWVIAGGAVALAGISWLCVKQLFQRPYLAAGWFWYLGTLIPVIGLVQVGSQGMADRYTYLPLIGPVISLVWLATEIAGRKLFYRNLLSVVAIVILAASVYQTRYQLQFWKNAQTIFKHTIEVTGENPRAEYILGLSLENKGQTAEAMVHYRNAITSQPRVKEAFYAMGRLLGRQGNWLEAAQTYGIISENEPNDFNANLGLATVLPNLNRLDEARAHLQTAIQTCPDDAEALNNLAWTLAASGYGELRDGTQAVKCGERACELTHYRQTIMIGTLAAAYAEAGRFDDAMATAQKACDLAAKNGETALLENNQALLKIYRQHLPFHETTGTSQ